jgi:hypothetical protein
MMKEQARHAFYPVTADDEKLRKWYQVTFATGFYVSLSGLTGRAMVLEFSRRALTVEAPGSIVG